MNTMNYDKSVLTDLILHFCKDVKMIRKINKVLKGNTYEAHQSLKKYLIAQYSVNNAYICAYFAAYNDFMYVMVGEDKVWYKPETTIIHNGDNPAVIKKDGTRIWYLNGYKGRNEVDDWGQSLPGKITPQNTMIWYDGGKCGRGELDECGQALPAIVNADGQNVWKYKGKLYTDDPATLTNIIKNL